MLKKNFFGRNRDFKVTVQSLLKFNLSSNSIKKSVFVFTGYNDYDIGHEESKKMMNGLFILIGAACTMM